MLFYNQRYLRRISSTFFNIGCTKNSCCTIIGLSVAVLIYILILQRKLQNFSKLVVQKDHEIYEVIRVNEFLRQKIDAILVNQVSKIYAQEHNNGPTNQSGDASSRQKPSLEYELLRRRVQTNIGEMWSYISHEFDEIKATITKTLPELQNKINEVLQLGAEHKRSLLSDMKRLQQVDGYEAWRHQESKDLSDLVQRRLHLLQNPKNCENSSKVLCNLNALCGYGCELHHVVYCFIIAYATERTMVLESSFWQYNSGGWEVVFQPVSESCFQAQIQIEMETPKLLILGTVDRIEELDEFMPLTIPEDLAGRLHRLYGDPGSWWVGQFLLYLLRPQNEISKLLDERTKNLVRKKPIVGVHVRRTDKVGTEAAFHSIEEYMTHVEDYFLTLEINSTAAVPRRIFLASDDARVIEEARKKYPHYEIIGDPDVARSAAMSTRYTDTALNGIILDIHLLSVSDYLVCTFSSQVCRVAYEIMQTLYPDAANRFKSLDDIYYYGYQNEHIRQAVIGHKSRNSKEIDLKPGDLISIMGNLWNGFSEGTNTRTNKSGLFPSFKVIDKVKSIKFPTYIDQ